MELPLHCSRLLRDLNAQRESGFFCDCQVLVRGQRFAAHRNLLSACSMYFRTVFLAGLPEPLAEPGVATATLDNLAPSVFAVILDFMYTARLALTSRNSEDVISAAGFLQMTELVRACKAFLGGRLYGSSPAAAAAATNASDNAASAARQPSPRKKTPRRDAGQLGFLKHVSLKRASPSETSARRGNPAAAATAATALGPEPDRDIPNGEFPERFNRALQTNHLNMIVIDVKEERGSLEEPQLPAEISNGEAWSSAACSQPEGHGRAQSILRVRRLGPYPRASAQLDRTGRRIGDRDEGTGCFAEDDDAAFIIVTVPPDGVKQEPDDCAPSNAAMLEGDECEHMDGSVEQLSQGPYYNHSLPRFRGKKFRIGDLPHEAHVFLDPRDLAGNLQPEGSALFTKYSGNDSWDTGERGAPSPVGGYPGCRPRSGSAWKQDADLTASGEKWDATAVFPCKHCPVRFTAKSNLVRHQQTVHAGQKLKFCDACQRNFRDSTDLQRHRLSKHWWQGRDGMCPFCPERFQVSRELLKHMQHRHRGLAAF